MNKWIGIQENGDYDFYDKKPDTDFAFKIDTQEKHEFAKKWFDAIRTKPVNGVPNITNEYSLDFVRICKERGIELPKS